MDQAFHVTSPDGSKSSPAACSAARAKSSSAACAARRSRGRGCRSSSRRSTIATARIEIVSHSEMKIRLEQRVLVPELLESVRPDTEVVGIDEGQFFDAELPAVCNELAGQGKRVIVAGLDQDYLGKPFEPMPQLLAIAEYITKTLAICMVCGGPANHTQRLVASKERVLVGATGHLRGAVPALLRSGAGGIDLRSKST